MSATLSVSSPVVLIMFLSVLTFLSVSTLSGSVPAGLLSYYPTFAFGFLLRFFDPSIFVIRIRSLDSISMLLGSIKSDGVAGDLSSPFTLGELSGLFSCYISSLS